MLKRLVADMEKMRDRKKAEILSGFFKTGKGEYGEGDKFLGIQVPDVRTIAHKYPMMSLDDVEKLLDSEVHEHRLAALLILVKKFDDGDEAVKKRIFDFYIRNAKKVNNWDLVDLSAHRIVGPFIENGGRSVIYRLAKSGNLWERRIAIIATMHSIRNGKFEDTFAVSQMLMEDKHDLIHKAVGWMLREVGKVDINAEEGFLRKHYKTMPRTALRYAIERFPEKKKMFYMDK